MASAEVDTGKKKKLYFFPHMDIIVLKQVIARNPFKNGNAVFGAIAEDLKSTNFYFNSVEKRTIQDRVERLIKISRQQQVASLRRSGTEEQYEQREKLMQEVSDLEREWSNAPKQLTGRKRSICSSASKMRKKSAKLHYKPGQQIKEQITPVQPRVLFDQIRIPVKEEPDTENHPLPAADNTPEDTDDGCLLQEPPTRVALAETSAIKLLSHLEAKVNMEAAWRENEFKLRQEELEIRKAEVKNERMRIELLQAEQQNRFRIEEKRRNEEREERTQIFDRLGKMTDALLSLMQKYDLK